MIVSTPRMMYSMASVTTRLGTRPIAVMIPVTIPQARPIAETHQEHDRDRDPVVRLEHVRRHVRRQADHRADRQVDVAGEDDERLADRHERVERGRALRMKRMFAALQEAAAGSRVVIEHEQRQHPDDPERPRAQDEVDEPPRARRRDRRVGAARRGRAHDARLPSGVPFGGAPARCRRRRSRSSDASSCVSVGDQPSLAHHEDAVRDREHLGQLGGDHQHGDAVAGQRREQPVDLGLGTDVDPARRLVDDQQSGLARRATSPARPSAGCRPTASVTGLEIRPYLTCSRLAQSAANERSVRARTAARRA